MRNKNTTGLTDEQLSFLCNLYEANGFKEAAENIHLVRKEVDFARVLRSFGVKAPSELLRR